MEFSEITLKDKELFDHYLGIQMSGVSELTFTNLFAWRIYYRFKYIVLADLLCIIADPKWSEPFALMPQGDLEAGRFREAYTGLCGYFSQRGWKPVFKKIKADELQWFRGMDIPEESIVNDRDNSDYIYRTEDLLHLRGKKFDGKRNHINKFKKHHTYEYVPLDASHLEECSRIMEHWCEDKNCACRDGEYCERQANMELLHNYTELGCKGAMIRVDGAVEAFTVGEMLTGDTAVIHIEKAKSSIDGLYTFVNQQFVEQEWSHTSFINREQDLGREGMRKAKLSYHPVHMVDKYTVNAV